jgi:hypothetical protein
LEVSGKLPDTAVSLHRCNMRQPYEATDMLADFELAGGRTTGLTKLASPRFEEKEALSARQMGDGTLLVHPQLGGDFRPAKMSDWTSMSRVRPVQHSRNVRPTELISITTIEIAVAHDVGLGSTREQTQATTRSRRRSPLTSRPAVIGMYAGHRAEPQRSMRSALSPIAGLLHTCDDLQTRWGRALPAANAQVA